jgi:hypothetical protein
MAGLATEVAFPRVSLRSILSNRGAIKTRRSNVTNRENFTYKNTLRDIGFAEFKWLRQICERRVAFVRFLREEAKSDIIQQFRNFLLHFWAVLCG